MDRKTVAIAVLTITAMLLAGVVVQGLREQPAYGQARPGGSPTGRYSNYSMVPMSISQNTEVLCVTDLITQRVIFFEYDKGSRSLVVFGTKGIDLKREMGIP